MLPHELLPMVSCLVDDEIQALGTPRFRTRGSRSERNCSVNPGLSRGPLSLSRIGQVDPHLAGGT
jgi:hypothetical protein